MTAVPVLQFVLPLFLALAQAGAPPPDRIVLKNGTTLAGRILERAKRYVLVEVGGRKRRVPRSKIARITDAEGHVRWADAIQFETKHYLVRTNVDEQRARALVGKLELFEGWFRREFARDWKLHEVRRMGVHLYRTRAEYERYAAGAGGLRRRLPLAFYAQGTGTLHTPEQNFSGENATLTALFHEAGHQLLHLEANFAGRPDLPHHWLTEGFAVLFEGLRIEDGKVRLGLARHRVLRAQDLLRRGKFRPLKELDAMTSRGFGADEYVQAYTLVHFFMFGQGGKYRRALTAFARDVWFTRARPDSFRKRFKAPIETFEEPWRAYVRELGRRLEAEARAEDPKPPRKGSRPGARGGR